PKAGPGPTRPERSGPPDCRPRLRGPHPSRRRVRRNDLVRFDRRPRIWSGSTDTPGARVTSALGRRASRPGSVIEPGGSVRPADGSAWVQEPGAGAVNLAGTGRGRPPG